MEHVYRIDPKSGKAILGMGLPAILRNGNYYSLQLVKIYSDAKIDCGGYPGLVDFDELVEKIKAGEIITKSPDGKVVDVFELEIEETDFLKVVKDTIAQLKGEKTSVHACKEAFEAFLSNPNTETQKVLKQKFLEMPAHRRAYVLGDQDAKDGPIRKVIDSGVDQKTLERYKKWYLPGNSD